MPLHFVNRWERFKSHELNKHWYYPVAFSDELATADVEPKLRELDSSLQPIRECWDIVKAHLEHRVRLCECVLSANAFGTEGRIHHDSGELADRAKHCSVLVYVNREWQAAWAGETVFFDEAEEITGAVLPKPGRVLIAYGDAPHVGRSVSRTCPTDRRVLVFKMWMI